MSVRKDYRQKDKIDRDRIRQLRTEHPALKSITEGLRLYEARYDARISWNRFHRLWSEEGGTVTRQPAQVPQAREASAPPETDIVGEFCAVIETHGLGAARSVARLVRSIGLDRFERLLNLIDSKAGESR